MKEMKKIQRAYEMLESKGVQPNFLFVGGGISDAIFFSSFILYAKVISLKLRGIILDNAPATAPNHFTSEHILGLSASDYIFLKTTTEQRDNQSSALWSLIKSCFCPKHIGPGRIQANHDITKLSECHDSLFLFYPASGQIPYFVLNFLSSINRPVIHIVLEEGIGSYLMSPKDWWYLGISREQKRLKRALKALILKSLWPFQRAQQSRLEKQLLRIPFTLFSQNRQTAIKNPISCEYATKAFLLAAEKFQIPILDYSNTVIIATTKFKDVGAQDACLPIIKDVISAVKQMGFDVLLRPHPGESSSEYYNSLNVEIDTHSNIALESLIARSARRPVAILGFMSSSQLFANVLWGVKAICVTDAESEKWNELARTNGAISLLNREILRAKDLFMNYVSFPCNIEELKSILECERHD